MSKPSKVFQPSQSELRGDATTRAAQAIIDTEAAAQSAKTDRLRAARLAQDEAKATARAHVDIALKKTGASGSAKAKRSDRLTEYPDKIRTKRRALGLE